MKNLAVRFAREFSASKLIVVAGVLSVVFSGASWAALSGTTSLTTPNTAIVTPVPAGTSAGTLLASESDPFSFTGSGGTVNGDLITAVYKESGGTLDFYYQLTNLASSTDEVEFLTDSSFTGFLTSVGYRTDGSTMPETGTDPFSTNGTVAAGTATRSVPSNVSFDFTPPLSSALLPGQTSYVLVISTNATSYTAGTAAIQDSSNITVAAYEPTSAVPEPSYSILLGGGLVLLAGLRRKLSARQ